MQLTEKHLEYWSKNLRVTAILLFIWFVVTFVMGYYARELSFNFFGLTTTAGAVSISKIRMGIFLRSSPALTAAAAGTLSG